MDEECYPVLAQLVAAVQARLLKVRRELLLLLFRDLSESDVGDVEHAVPLSGVANVCAMALKESKMQHVPGPD